MTIIIPDGYAQVVHVWSSGNFDTGNAVTTHGISLDEDSPEAAANRWREAMENSFLAIMTQDVSLVETQVLTETTSAFSASGQAGGSGTETMNPPNIAVLVKEPTERRGRRGQGRMFLPGLAFDSQVDSRGNLAPGYLEDLQSAADFYFTAGIPAFRALVVLQRTTPTGPGAPENPTPPINPPPPVTSLQVQPKVASQRRRLRS